MGIRACLNTNADSVGWISDPNVRGTLSLLISCLTTLALCTYSAIHLNLPKAQESTTAYIWRHLKWTLTGIFGPELVIWAAWRQNVSARNLRQDLSKIQANLPSVCCPWNYLEEFLIRNRITLSIVAGPTKDANRGL